MEAIAPDSKVRPIGATRNSSVRVKNFFEYLGPRGQKLHGYQRRYKGVRLRRQGFITKSDAERDLRREMNDVDARERGEVRYEPTTAQEALSICRHNLDVRARDKVMEATGNDVALVMSYSGHRSMESFKVYLHPTQKGSILANQHIETVGHLLATFAGMQGTTGTSGTDVVDANSLELKEVAL